MATQKKLEEKVSHLEENIKINNTTHSVSLCPCFVHGLFLLF